MGNGANRVSIVAVAVAAMAAFLVYSADAMAACCGASKIAGCSLCPAGQYCDSQSVCKSGTPPVNPPNPDCQYVGLWYWGGQIISTGERCKVCNGSTKLWDASLNCNDSNMCTADVCSVSNDAPSCSNESSVTCTASDQCHNVGVCQPTTGVCSNPAKRNGASCNDSNECTQTDSCQSGICTGSSPVTCTASDQCHKAGVCDTSTGHCSNPAKADGSSCSDGSLCTQTDTCQSGTCVSGSAVSCDDGNSCTTDSCNPTTGCGNVKIGSGVENACGGCSTLSNAPGGACDGADVDSCKEGIWTCFADKNSVYCNDPNDVNTEICDVLDNDCDGQIDEGFDVGASCSAGTGTCQNTGVKICKANGTGTECSVSAKPDGTSCNDGNGCTQGDSCVNGSCESGSSISCNDGKTCTTDSCNSTSATTYSCFNPITTGCLIGGVCIAEGASNPKNPCEVCNSALAKIAWSPAPIGTTCRASAGICDVAETCVGATCPADGFKSNTTECRVSQGQCDLVESCTGSGALCPADVTKVGQICDDNNKCTTGEACDAGLKCSGGAAVSCDDSNPCTDDSCSKAAGCSHANNSASCTDGNACTEGDNCSNGECVSGTPKPDDKSQACKVGTCNPATGGYDDYTNIGSGSKNWCNGCEEIDPKGSCGEGNCGQLECDGTDSTKCTPGPDTDGDGVPDCIDNCPEVANPGQEDFDADEEGDVCDPGCGNGVQDDGEECDAGADNSDGVPNACRADCTKASCGDGVKDDGEACDDGKEDEINCRENCSVPSCGDGIPDIGEECDGGEGCRENCTAMKCGDGTADPGEACDDGNEIDTDDCLTGCTLPSCGDGVVQTGVEECDDGPLNNDDEIDACRTNCKNASCGDGVADSGEACDDKNDVDTDDCRNNCSVPGCGDGIPDAGEECDKGAGNSDSEANACRTSCKDAFCGDKVKDDGEECDGGIDCRANCTKMACGDEILDPGEECDEGALNSDKVPDACRTDCKKAHCGDGVTDLGLGEVCDDGDAVNGTIPAEEGKEPNCDGTCSGDYTWCGNDTIDVPTNSQGVPEQCDGKDFGGKTCADPDLGFTQGTLSCESCALVTDECVKFDCDPGETKGCSIDAQTLGPCEEGQQTCGDDGEWGACTVAAKIDDTACDDGNMCTTGDKCSNGDCGGESKDCSDSSVCTNDICDTLNGQCMHSAKAPGGVCCDTVADCNDNNLCTTDSCQANLCANVPMAPKPCNSGACTGTATCQGDEWICDAQPATAESCNGVDDDCDGVVDDGFGEVTCGIGECMNKVQLCVGGMPQTCISISPSSETCDGKDNDCDGQVDDGLTKECSTACGEGTDSCQDGAWTGCTVPVPSAEVCDGVDNDCDGEVDEGVKNACGACGDVSAEACDNGVDDDCDGQVDEECEDVSKNGNSIIFELQNNRMVEIPLLMVESSPNKVPISVEVQGEYPEQVIIITGETASGQIEIASINTADVLDAAKPEFMLDVVDKDSYQAQPKEKAKSAKVAKLDGTFATISIDDIKQKFGDAYDSIASTTKVLPASKTSVFTADKYSIRTGVCDDGVITPDAEDVENYLCASTMDVVEGDLSVLPDHLVDFNGDNYGGNELMAICYSPDAEGNPQEMYAIFFRNRNETPLVDILVDTKEMGEEAADVNAMAVETGSADLKAMDAGAAKIKSTGAGTEGEREVEKAASSVVMLDSGASDLTNDALTVTWRCTGADGTDCADRLTGTDGSTTGFRKSRRTEVAADGRSTMVDDGPCPYNIGVTATDAGGASAEDSIVLDCAYNIEMPLGAPVAALGTCVVECSFSNNEFAEEYRQMTADYGGGVKGDLFCEPDMKVDIYCLVKGGAYKAAGSADYIMGPYEWTQNSGSAFIAREGPIPRIEIIRQPIRIIPLEGTDALGGKAELVLPDLSSFGDAAIAGAQPMSNAFVVHGDDGSTTINDVLKHSVQIVLPGQDISIPALSESAAMDEGQAADTADTLQHISATLAPDFPRDPTRESFKKYAMPNLEAQGMTLDDLFEEYRKMDPAAVAAAIETGEAALPWSAHLNYQFTLLQQGSAGSAVTSNTVNILASDLSVMRGGSFASSAPGCGCRITGDEGVDARYLVAMLALAFFPSAGLILVRVRTNRRQKS